MKHGTDDMVEQSLRGVVDRYELERMPARQTTARTYRSLIKNHILPRWGDESLSSLTPRSVELWLQSLCLAPKSKAHVRALLYAIVEFAMWTGIMPIGRNPISLVRNAGANRRVRTPRSLTVEEFRALLSKLSEPLAMIAVLCVCLGLRISEALGLLWDDVDWSNSRLRVERGVVAQVVAEVKTPASARLLFLPPPLKDRLQSFHRACAYRKPSDWIFASPVRGGLKPYSYTGIRRMLGRAASAANISNLATHTFRHTYRSWLDAIGTPITVQQKLMRHADIRTTLNIYGDVARSEMVWAGTQVARLVH